MGDVGKRIQENTEIRMITEVPDIDLIEDVKKYDVVLVGTNTYNRMSNGFQRKVKKLHKHVYEANKKTGYGDPKKVGTILPVPGEPEFVICYISHGYDFRPFETKVFVNYEAIEKCLREIATRYRGKRIATTLMGATPFDGNGDVEKIRAMYDEIFGQDPKMDVYLYTYTQKSYKDEQKEEWDYLKSVREVDRQRYYELCDKRHKDREAGTKMYGWI